MKRIIAMTLLLVVAFIAGHDFALTRLATDMFFGRTFIRDNGLIMEIRHRRVFEKIIAFRFPRLRQASAGADEHNRVSTG